MEGKIRWPFNLLMFQMFTSQNCWKVNEGIQAPLWNGMFTKFSKPNRYQTTNYQKPPHAYMVNIYGINLFYLFNSYTKDVIIYNLKVFWSRYQCGYGPKDCQENSTHTRFIKWRCLVSFAIKRLYTRPNVVEITIYHKGTYTNWWVIRTWWAWPEIHFSYVSLCSTHVISIKGPHMGPTKFRLHNQTNIWQA
jgi:hypothetical protein